MEILIDQLLVVADIVAEQGQDYHPDTGSQAGEGGKQGQVHAGNAGGQADVLPDTGEQSADKGRYMTVIGKKMIRLVQAFLTHQHITTVLFEKRTTPYHGQPVVKECTEQTPANPGEDDQGEGHLTTGRQVSGRRHHHFTGKGEEGGFEKHHDNDAGVPPLPHCLDNPVDDIMQHFHNLPNLHVLFWRQNRKPCRPAVASTAGLKSLDGKTSLIVLASCCFFPRDQ